MLSIVHNKFVEFIVTVFEKYGIKLQAQYNSEIGLIKQYIGSLNYRYMYKDKLPSLTEDDIKAVNSYNLLLYKYHPLKKVDNRLNNINLELVFTGQIPEFEVQKIDSNYYEFVKYLRELNDKHIVRDAILGEIEYEFQILSTNTDLINEMQFIYNKELRNPRIFTIKFTFEGIDEPLELTYQVWMEDIEDVGHVDYENYGNLQQISFSGKIEGPILSSYQTEIPSLKEIDLIIDV